MAFKIIGKKDEKKGFSIDSVLELANGVKVKIADLLKLHNGIVAEAHDVDENQEIELPNGKSVKLIDLVNEWKLANKDTDENEKSDEDKNKEKAEGEDRDKSIKNCGCAGKEDGDHKDGCALYNAPKAVEFRNNKEKEDKSVMNAKIDALEKENKALKEGSLNIDAFVKINNARNKSESEDKVLLQNGTLESGSLLAGAERGRKYFGSAAK